MLYGLHRKTYVSALIASLLFIELSRAVYNLVLSFFCVTCDSKIDDVVFFDAKRGIYKTASTVHTNKSLS